MRSDPRSLTRLIAVLAALWLPPHLAWAQTAPPAAAPSLATADDPTDPPPGVFTDEWYAVLLNGRKCGVMRSRMERMPREGDDHIYSQTKFRMSVKREAMTVTLGVHQKTLETIAGQPLSFSQKIVFGQKPVLTEGTIKDGKVTVNVSQLGQELPTRTYNLPDGAHMDWALYLEQFRHGFEPGTTYEVGVYDPSIAPQELCPARVEILQPETIDLFGRKVEAVKARMTMEIPSMLGSATTQKTTTWITREGDVLKVEMSVMDIPVQILACSKTVAMAEDDPFELTASMVITLDKPIRHRYAKAITYRVKLKESADQDRQLDLPTTPMQHVVRTSPRELEVTVTRPGKDAKPAGSPEAVLELRDRYLAADPMLNHTDPVVARLAEEAVGKETDPRRIAGALLDFVHDFVQTKDLSVGFATASEVARTRTGDCSEHAVLLAALGRARGIPSRLVAGLVYAGSFGHTRNVLVGHLWTQFWIDGRWVDLDPALGQNRPDATHLAMSFGGAGDSTLSDLVTATWLGLQDLSIQVLDSK